MSKGLSFLKTCLRILSHLQGAYNLDNAEAGKKAQKRLVFKMSCSRLWFLVSLVSAVAHAERTGPGAEAPRTCPRLGAGRGRAGSLAGEVSKASQAAGALQATGALPRLLPVLPPSTKLCRFYITFIE